LCRCRSGLSSFSRYRGQGSKRFTDHCYWMRDFNISPRRGKDLGECSTLRCLNLECCLFAFDNQDGFALLKSIPFLLQPFNHFSGPLLLLVRGTGATALSADLSQRKVFNFLFEFPQHEHLVQHFAKLLFAQAVLRILVCWNCLELCYGCQLPVIARPRLRVSSLGLRYDCLPEKYTSE
jgi:hypothetical protein